MILRALKEAQAAGARLSVACEQVGLDPRTVQRWRGNSTGEDRRRGPITVPHNRLTAGERKELLEVVSSPDFCDLSPKQIVPKLADLGLYLASESTIHRLLRELKLDAHRGRQKPREAREVTEHVATGPNQVWSWDITYLRAPVRGQFFYLYLIVDVWSRKAVGAQVFPVESGELASQLMKQTVAAEGADAEKLALHQDNGAAMTSSTLKATLEALGILGTYSRPHVSDDNPYSESLFRTFKYWPGYPTKGFDSLEHAEHWVGKFVTWYNTEHLHSGIGFVTPCERHEGLDLERLSRRRAVYTKARQRHPERWSRGTRQWSSPRTVYLNPSKQTQMSLALAAQNP